MDKKPNPAEDFSKPRKPSSKGPLLAFFSLFFIAAVSFVLIASVYEIYKTGCFNRDCLSVVKPSAVKEKGIKKFKNYEELKEFIRSGAENASVYGMHFGRVSMDTENRAVTDNKEIQGWGAASAPSAIPSGRVMDGMSRGGDFSTTNVQVAGVDEGDIVKTDGKYVYAVSKKNVYIIDAYPASEAVVLSSVTLDSSPMGIYVNGDKLVVYGYNYDISKNKAYENLKFIRRNSSYTFFKVFDISDRRNPKEERDLNFEGNFVSSRLIGDYVYFVTSKYDRYGAYYDDEETLLPLVIENGKVLKSDESKAGCYCPDVYYFDIPYRSYNFVTVSSVNIADSGEKIGGNVYLLDGVQNNMFVSSGNIYITFTKYVSEEELAFDVMKEIIVPKLEEKNRLRIREIENAKNYVLSRQEKLRKIMMIIERFAESLTEEERKQLEEEIKVGLKRKYEDISKELEKTVIHKIAINKENVEYKASGEVRGVVLNQFSMNESGSYFYIATTKNRRWSSFSDLAQEQESYSNLYVLDGNMEIVGKVEKLAKGERIYSVRFMQDRAYMVTFRRTDPLFVIDLKNPSRPKVLGELKVPGFSSYLHPYDETTLIGLGKETDENGRVTGGIKLSLFDVSDVSNPKELDKYVLGDSSSNSAALNDHKAFLFSKDKNLLVIPVSMRVSGVVKEELPAPDTGTVVMPDPITFSNFNGAVVFSIDKYRFNLRGKIDHYDLSAAGKKWGYDYNTAVKRSLYIKDALYTLSNMYLKANSLDDLKEIKSLILDKTQ